MIGNIVSDIVTGWNTEFFDIPYLCNRIKYVLGEDELKDYHLGSLFNLVKFTRWVEDIKCTISKVLII